MFSLWRNILNRPNVIAKDDGYFNANNLQNQFFCKLFGETQARCYICGEIRIKKKGKLKML